MPGMHIAFSEKSSVKCIVPTENPHEIVTCLLERHQVLWKDNSHSFIRGDKSAILLRSTSTHCLTWARKKYINIHKICIYGYGYLFIWKQLGQQQVVH